MSGEESIYNLVPSPPKSTDRGKMYRSSFPGALPVQKQAAATFGPPSTETSPKRFLKKGIGSTSPAGSPTKKELLDSLDKRDLRITKAPVPSRNDVPVMGLVSHKNYITANAVDNILMVPKRSASKEVDYLKKEEYGKVPSYLKDVKEQVEREYQLIAEIERDSSREEHDHIEMITDEERQELLKGMKDTWEKINKEYQALSFTLDTESKKKRKETYENQLEQIEKDIRQLSKKFVFLAPHS